MKIPRAHPVYPVAAEVASVASDTIPSDYPSETPSEAEHAQVNQAFMMDESYHSEGTNIKHELWSYLSLSTYTIVMAHNWVDSCGAGGVSDAPIKR